MTTLGHHLFAQGADLLCHDLDRILGRVTRQDARLRVERESRDMWIVVDAANADVVMYRSPDQQAAGRFAAAFLRKENGSQLQESGEPMASLRHAGRAAHEPASPDNFSVRVPDADNVLPFERRKAI